MEWSPSYQFRSVTQSHPTLCDPMNHSMPGLPVHHQLPESTQTRVHQVGDAIQASHPLSPPSPPALSLSQNQGLFKWLSSSHQVTKVLEFQLQHQSFPWTSRTDPLYDGLVESPCSPRDSQESSLTPQSKNINSLVLSLLYSPTLTSIHDYWKNYSFDYMDLCQQSIWIFVGKVMSLLFFFLASPSSFFSSFIFISRRLITSQHCSGFCHTLTWISHGVCLCFLICYLGWS